MTGLSNREERIEVPVGESVRMFSGWHQAEEIDDVDEAYLQIGRSFFLRIATAANASMVAISPAQAITTSGSLQSSVEAQSQIPNALRAVRYGILHAEVLQVVLLVRNNYV